MRKEIIIAIFIGILFGLIVTYGIYTANKAIVNKQKGISPQTTTIPTPTPLPSLNLEIEIDQPENNLVFSQPNITIEGKTAPEAIVAIMAENENLFTIADTQGNFSQKISLIKGANVVNIQATDPDTNKTSTKKTLDLVYSNGN